MTHYDAIIAGTGPAGASALFNLTRQGLKVLALEKEIFPRYKPCGGCLSSKTRNFLHMDLSGLVQTEIYQVNFSYNLKEDFAIKAPGPVGYMVNRSRLDDLLVERAIQAGGLIHFGEKVTGWQKQKNRLEITTPKNTYTADYLLSAEGAGGIIGSSLNWHKNLTFYPTVTVEIDGDFPLLHEHPQTAWTDLFPSQGAYGWIFPKENGITLGVGKFSPRKKVKLPEVIEQISRYRLQKDSSYKIHPHPIPCLHNFNKYPVKDGIFLLGDSGGLVDAFIGEGIYYAVFSGELAAQAILQSSDPKEAESKYAQNLKTHIYPELRAAGWIAAFMRRFPRIAYKLLKDHALMADFYRGVLGGEKSYQEVTNRVRNRLFLDSRLPQWLIQQIKGEKS